MAAIPLLERITKGVKRELNKKLRNGNWTTKEIIEAMDKIK